MWMLINKVPNLPEVRAFVQGRQQPEAGLQDGLAHSGGCNLRYMCRPQTQPLREGITQADNSLLFAAAHQQHAHH